MKFVARLVVASAIAFSPITIQSVMADEEIAATAVNLPSGEFVRKQKRISGTWSVEQRGSETVIVFADDFKASSGPDLKVFLSPQTISDVTGKTAIAGALLLGELQSNRGTQVYSVPAGIDLSDYESVLVHCEAYEVLWGGGDL